MMANVLLPGARRATDSVLLALVGCGISVAAHPALARAASTTWTNTTGNQLWSDPLNWTNGVPTANTDVALTLEGFNTIDLAGATQLASNVAKIGWGNGFRLINGTLDATGFSAVDSYDGDLTLDCISTNSRGALQFAGLISVNGAIVGDGVGVNVAGNVRFSGENTYTGHTVIDGDLAVSGSIADSSVVRVRGRLNSGGFDPIGASARVRLEAGTWVAYEPARAGTIEFADRTSTLSAYSGANSIGTITIGAVQRLPGATAQLGLYNSSPVPGIVGLRLSGALPPMFGDGASPTRLPILPWATAQYLASISGGPDASFVTYDRGANPDNPNDDVGFRALRDPSDYVTTLVDGANVKLSSATALAGPWNPNSLTLKGTSLTLAPGSGDVSLASGAILFLPGASAQASIQAPPGSSAAITAPGEMVLLAFGGNREEYNFSHPHYLVDAPLRADSLLVSGGGTLELFRANSFPHGVHIIDTAVVLHDIRALGEGSIDLATRSYTARLWIPDANQTLTNGLVLHTGSAGQLSLPSTGVTTWSGRVSGSGSLWIAFGTLRMTGGDNGTDSYQLRMGGGTVILDGSYTSRNAALVVGSSPPPGFFGHGTFLGTFQPGGGLVSPGDPLAGSTGRLTLGSGTWSRATLREEINGILPADEYDQLVFLDGLTFDTTAGRFNTLDVQFGNGFVPAVGDRFTIFDNRFADPVVGYFADLPEGTIFSAAGSLLQISYAGGDGNDVVLSVVPEPMTGAMMGVAIAVAMSSRRGQFCGRMRAWKIRRRHGAAGQRGVD